MSKIAVFLVLAEGGLCLIPIPKGTLPQARRASVKELGIWGLVPKNNNIKL